MSAAAERACLAAAQPPDETASDLAHLVALDVAQIAETCAMPRTAAAALTARTSEQWFAIARSFGLGGATGPLINAALDAAMMMSTERLVAAADALAIARGLTLRQWCAEMRAT